MSVISLPKSSKHDARQRVAEIANDTTGKVYFSDHCRLRMQERDITSKQVINVLRRGVVVGEISWDTKVESGWKMTVKAITAGAEIRVAAKLIDRGDECVVALTTFEKF